MDPTVGPTHVQSVKLQHPYFHHHCQEFSRLLTSTRLMIIAKEETTHNTQASKKGKLAKSHHTGSQHTIHIQSYMTVLPCEIPIHINPTIKLSGYLTKAPPRDNGIRS